MRISEVVEIYLVQTWLGNGKCTRRWQVQVGSTGLVTPQYARRIADRIYKLSHVAAVRNADLIKKEKERKVKRG